MENSPAEEGGSEAVIMQAIQREDNKNNSRPVPNGYKELVIPPIVTCSNDNVTTDNCCDSVTASCHEAGDSGVHSGTELGSDTKSTSSSPGLSADSSVNELYDNESSQNSLTNSSPLLQSEKSICCSTSKDIENVSDAVSKLAVDANDLLQEEEEEQDIENGLTYVVYKSELQMPDIMNLITKDLSEPYSIYTYRYFIHNWPKLCFLAMDGSHCVGAIVCKLGMHKKMIRRGYIAMLAVDQNYRRKGIGSHLVLKAIRAMIKDDCDEVVLETEITNKAALRLYENLGFVRDKRLFRYYLNGVDALRLKLWLR